MFPWCPSLSWAPTRTVYFHDFGVTKARNLCPELVICLYKSPLTWVKSSASCLGAFPFDKHLEICLQKGSVFSIWRRAPNLSAVKDLDVGCDVGVMSGVTCCCAVDWSDARHCWVWLLVLKAGPSLFETNTMLIDADGIEGSSTRCDKTVSCFVLSSWYPLECNIVCC